MTIGTWHDRLGRLSPRTIDVGVAAAVAVAMTLTISVATEEEASREPGVLAYLLGLTVAALLLARRRHPMPVLIGSVGVLFIYYSLDYPAFSPAVPMAVAAYSAAVAGRIVPAAVIVAGVVVFGVGWQTLGEDETVASVLGTGTLADASLLTAVLLLGEAVRSRRAWAREVRLRMERAEREREREAARRVEEERLRIARELHDVVAHTIATINVQAGVAADVLDDEPEEAEASLRTIREQSRAAIAELKATVGLLRGDDVDAPRAPAPGLAVLDGLIEMAAGAGVRVDVSISGAVRALPGAVDLTAYRIVQESLTNVVRHADASVATITIDYGAEAVELLVEDDGVGARNGAGEGGYGLLGMRERAAALGGSLRVGSAADGGYRVHARLPTPPVAR